MPEVLPDSSTYLKPPSKTTEMEDPGAEDSVSNSDEEHFSDASEGHAQSNSSPQSGNTFSVPHTRVERVDSTAQHGEIPGTEAYEKRERDAVPDEIAVVSEGAHNDPLPAGSQDRPLTPGGSPIPQTMVEKVDPELPSHGEVPGTEAYAKRQADAVPDMVRKASDSEKTQPSPGVVSQNTSSSEQSIPETRVTRVDTLPVEEEVASRPLAHRGSLSDAQPDSVETIPETSMSELSPLPAQAQQEFISQGGTCEEKEGDHNHGAADDFDEFVEEQDEMGDDDFGDFDDGFQEPDVEVEGTPTGESVSPQQLHAPPSVPPLTDFDVFKSTSELLSALQGTLDNLLPASQDLKSFPPVEPIPDSAAVFSTERSLSLWSQLVAPPPLQPQNWVKSRIRRLFLVSLGVPVDLDEILPASKQKKLVLPSIDLDGSGTATAGRSRSHGRRDGEPSNDAENAATSGQAPTRSKTTRRGAPPQPELDLSSVRRLCATTDAALSGLTDSELKMHIQELEQITLRASAVLEYWLKRRDGLVGEKEAFEGVIENLVSHVRRVRK
ncbi:uncharacterized protein N7459_008738 [Penicillium hispanicum]|uniref:uncharacterized protein n=1 Tax=Penicillium hispanicum TaxID=1080232 RepID=UPI0025401467|nr:uncharacterized protein N7459_008738 [Penicillium hispanicum]KAJ5574311.1 hypothetical protein N7459_008738 [Penicillium hispanicum]